jgi:plasmid stabilization system protein ParE
MPARGRPAGADSRELDVKFGSDWYVIRFRIIGERVVVTRIFHGRERR